MKDYVNIMSKISKESAMELDRICAEKGFRSKYELLQYLVTSFLRVNTNRCNEEEKILLNRLFSSKLISDYVRPGHRKKKSKSENEDIIMICNGRAYQIQECGCLNIVQVSTEKLIDNIGSIFPDLGFLMKSFGRCNKKNLILKALKSYTENHINDDINDEFRLYSEPEQGVVYKRKKIKNVE